MSQLQYIHSIDAKSKDAPLIIMFHGYGSNKEDLFGLKPLFRNKANIISVQAPIDLSHLGGWGAYAWFNLDFMPDGIHYKMSEVDTAIEKAINFVEYAKDKYATDKSKIIVLGFSQGAMLCHAITLKAPKLIDASACLSGRMVDELFHDQHDFSLLKNHPIFISHGVDDEVIPIEVGGRGINKYYADKGLQLTYQEYDMAHGINVNCERDLVQWFNDLI